MSVLLKSGAHFLPNDTEVLRELCIAASRNDIDSLRLWRMAAVDLSISDMDGRTPLHVVSFIYNLHKPFQHNLFVVLNCFKF